MIPTLAFSIATMSGYAASNMMGSVGGIVNSGNASSAASAVAGNRQMGIVREDMISANKYDVAMNVSTGSRYSHSQEHLESARYDSTTDNGEPNETAEY